MFSKPNKQDSKSQKEIVFDIQFLSEKEFAKICGYPKKTCGAFFQPIKNPSIILKIEGLSYGIIIHECVHACQYITQVLNQKMDDEQQAYFIEGLFTNILQKAQKNKFKIYI